MTVALLPAAPLAGQAAPTFARVDAYRNIEILDLQRKTWRRVHRVAEWATDLTVSPFNDRLAFLSWTEPQRAEGDTPLPRSELVVVDTSGKVIPSNVKQVQRYAWCGPHCLVYITGQQVEGHRGFIPDSIGSLDLVTGQVTPLPAPPQPTGISWAAHEGAAYVKNWPGPGEALVYRLDLAVRTLSPTPLRDYRFSPTGRYYLYEGDLTDTLVLYQTSINRPVDLEPLRREAIVLGWGSSTEDVLLTVKRPPPRTQPPGRPRVTVKSKQQIEADQNAVVTYHLYDVARGRIRATLKGALRSWAAPENLRLMQREGGYHIIGAPGERTVAGARPRYTFARLVQGNTVELLDLRKSQWHRVYQSPNWSLNGLSVAPAGDQLALLAWTKGVVSGHEYSVPPSPELIVLDTLGRKLAAVPKVQRYDWCGPGCVVYLTGEYEETDIGFWPGGVGMLNVATGAMTELPAPPYPIGITWGPLDGAAYVKNAPDEGEPNIFRVDLKTRALSATELKDHLFSPTGKYYLHGPHFTDSLLLYHTSTNQQVDLSRLRRHAKIIGWASSHHDVLLTMLRRPVKPVPRDGRPAIRPLRPSDERDETYQLYRVSDGRVLSQVVGRFGVGHAEWFGPGRLRLIKQGDKYTVLDGR